MAILTIERRESLDRVWEQLTYFHARAVKDPIAQDLAPQVQPLVERLAQIRVEQYRCWAAEMVAQAGVDYQDDTLDDLVSDVDHQLLHLVSGDRKSSRYTRYFSEAPNKIIRMGLQSEVEKVATWPANLKREPEVELQKLGDRFASSIDQSHKAIEERRQAISATANHRIDKIEPLIDDANRTLTSLYGILMQRSVDKGLPKSWASRFFRHRSRRRVEAPVEPKAPGTP